MLTRADEPYTSQGRTSSSYYAWLTDTFRHKREVLAKGLERSGLVPMEGQGGFFLMADTSALNVPEEYMRHTTAAAPQAHRAAPPAPPTHPPTLAPSHPRTLASSHPRTLAPSHHPAPRPPPSSALRSSTPRPMQMTRDWALCRWLAIEGGVIAIPSSPFFSAENKELGAKYVRFAFCKADSTLDEASEKIAQLVEKQRASE